ncbi:HNH endonuclease [Mechercharimyces sp. CAU 1602]|nr:HNH endonuclease [Mechercharimyces sp. CAU 1602]
MRKKPEPFYRSRAWKKAREFVLARDHYLCQRCWRNGKLTPAEVVHHVHPLKERPERALDADNLVSVCATCHNKLHPEKGKRDKRRLYKARVIRSVANEEMV